MPTSFTAPNVRGVTTACRLLVVVLCLVAGVLCCGVSTAGAAQTHLFETSFGPDGTAASAFEEPGAVGVDQSTGDAYVADLASGTVQKFNSAHEPTLFTGVNPAISGSRLTGFTLSRFGEIAVDSTSHDFYVTDEAAIRAFQADGTPALFTAGPGAGTNEIPGIPGTVRGVAVDSNGDIYVGAFQGGVHVYAPSGELIATVSGESEEARAGMLAVDSHGTVYVNNVGPGPHSVVRFTPSEFPVTNATIYEEAATVVADHAQGLAVDPATSHLYVLEGEAAAIGEYEEAGTLLDTFASSGEGALHEPFGIAVNDFTGGQVYVSDLSGKHVEIFGPAVKLPDVTTGAVSEQTLKSAVLHGDVNPAGAQVTSCVFEYGTSTAYGASMPCSPQPGSGSAPVAVSAALTGLTQGTVYHYRLAAANVNAPAQKAFGADRTLATGPAIQSTSALNATATSVDLQASIDPLGTPTTYHFQYGTTPSYGSSAPVPSPALDVSQGPQTVSLHLNSLAPGTVYHYRTVAETPLGTVTSPDETFTTQALETQEALPDGRAWEMVTPPNKYGANLVPIAEEAVIQASASGDAITDAATGPIEANPPSYTFVPQELSRRTAAGWSSKTIAVPLDHAQGVVNTVGSEFRYFSDDLSHALLEPPGQYTPSLLSAEASEKTPFLRSDFGPGGVQEPCAGACYRPLVTGAPGYANVPPGTVFGNVQINGQPCHFVCGPEVLGATPDASHVVLESQLGVELTLGTTEGLYEWAAGKLSFVGVPRQLGYHAISSDGQRVVFTGESEGHNGLLLRDMTAGRSVQLDAVVSGCVSGCEAGGGVFQFASADASRVFFTDTHRLTTDAGAAPNEPDLYECQVLGGPAGPQCTLTDLTPIGAGGEHANVESRGQNGGGGVLGISTDGAYVYFVAGGKLAAGAQEHAPCGGLGAPCNLYVRHEGQTRLVAILDGGDEPDWKEELVNHTSRVSPDGQWLAFMSKRPLTGYDNRDAVSGERDEEVYLYHAPTGSLVCASCNPTGARPHGVEYHRIVTSVGGIAGGSRVWPEAFHSWIAANVPGWTHPYTEKERRQPRYLSDSGRLFFNSSDALVSKDVNGTEDVYQYEPVGVPAGPNACSISNVTYSSRSGGCVGLISSGESKEESAFLDASATGGRDGEGHEGGGDVFFLTAARLSPQDFDASRDIYDAHECTAGSPCIPPAAVPAAECVTADSCRAAPSQQPSIFGPPSSATFAGPGNLTEPPPPPPAKPKALTNAQKLKAALRACHKRYPHSKKRRLACERQAHHRYAAKRASQKVRGRP